jgi:rhamnulokinase
VDSVLRWDARALFAGILDGLRAAAGQAGPLDAVSVDGWAVDYGLLDGDGITATPGGVAGVDAARLYEATGIAVHSFNTVFQLLAERESAQMGAARHVLLGPDLMTYWLSGQMGTELTNASTTGLLDTRTMTWATAVADALGVPSGLFPRLVGAGELAEPVTRRVAAELGAARPQVVVGPSHDTAAAVAGVPAADGAFAFVCTGTWALAGVELAAPVITGAGREAGFSNEAGIDGTIRFLRNVTGFWLLQECVREWQAEGRRVGLDELTRGASEIPGHRALIDVQDPGFAAPGAMTERITRACLRISGVSLSSEAEILRCILDSMAVAIRQAVRDAVRVTGHPVRTVHIVGGGVANPLFCQLVANACGLPAVAGPTEAASWGNVLVQARALGLTGGSLPELRSFVRRSVHLTRYEPDEQEATWERADEVVLASRAPVSRSKPCSKLGETVS